MHFKWGSRVNRHSFFLFGYFDLLICLKFFLGFPDHLPIYLIIYFEKLTLKDDNYLLPIQVYFLFYF